MVYVYFVRRECAEVMRIGTARELSDDADWRPAGTSVKWLRRLGRVESLLEAEHELPKLIVRQMKGSEAGSAAIRARFAHLRVFPDRLLYRLAPELEAFVAERTEEWTHQDHQALGFSPPKAVQRGQADPTRTREVDVKGRLAARRRVVLEDKS